MQDVAVRENETPSAQDESASLLAVIAKAAADPNVNVEKMERLLAMRDRERVHLAKLAYIKALAEMKPELPVIDRKGRIEVREKDKFGKRTGNLQQSTPFARWEDIDEAITPILAEHGFALSFRAGAAQDGKIAVTGILSHEEGHSEENTITLPHDSSGSKNPVQAVGSSLSYGKRYAATFLLNIRTKGEDDDGEAAGAGDPIDESQLQHIRDLVGSTNSDPELFCNFMEVDALKDIKRKDYEKAIVALNTKAEKLKKKAPK